MEKILPWMTLKSVPGIGNYLFKRLIDSFKTPESAFEASTEDLLQVEGITSRIASSIRHHKIPDSVKKELDKVRQKGYQIVTMADLDYPTLLLQLPDPPPYLYVYGRLDNSRANIAVVGSRNATGYGITTTKNLCHDLALMQFAIISGMAKGVDTAAHQGTLLAKGKTIAVLGSGMERVYPPENMELFHQIAEDGAVVSEFSMITEPEAHNFPSRNRIISGMSLGTVVVEASKISGSLITARLAAEQGREVFAVPGSIRSFKSMGTHSLLKQGAKLVEHAQDIAEELAHLVQPVETDELPDTMDEAMLLNADESTVFNALEPYPVHIDDLKRKLSIEPGKLSSILLKLELKGIVDQAPGKRFSINEVK